MEFLRWIIKDYPILLVFALLLVVLAQAVRGKLS